MNCYEAAVYDFEIGAAICDTCFILGNKQNVYSEACNYCNNSEEDIIYPKLGQKIHYPTDEEFKKIFNRLYNYKITIKESYDVIIPINLDNGRLEYYSNVENKIQFIELNTIDEIEVIGDVLPSFDSYDSNLKELKDRIKEHIRIYDKFEYKELFYTVNFKEKEYIRLVGNFEGWSWDKSEFNKNDILKKNKAEKINFRDGLTLSLNTLLYDKIEDFFDGENHDSFYIDNEKNKIYLIEKISRIKVF